MSDANPEYFVIAVGKFCFVFVILISLILFIIKWIIFSKTHYLSKRVIIFAILGSIFYGLASLFSGLYWLSSIDIINSVFLENISDALHVFFWHLGQVMVYCYLLIRLYNGFKGTIYAITNRTSMILRILLCCYLFGCSIILSIMIWYVISYSMNEVNSIDDLKYDTELEITYKSIALVIDFILSTSLLVIFIQKLSKINKESERLIVLIGNDLCRNNTSNMESLMMTREVKTLRKQTENIYDVMTKTLILGVIIIISSQIAIILALINWIRNKDSNDTLTVIYGWFKGIHTIIGTLSIFLGFEFFQNWYVCCCGSCHRWIKSCCIANNNGDIIENLQYKLSGNN